MPRRVKCPKCGGSGRKGSGIGFKQNCSRSGGAGRVKDARVDPLSRWPRK